MGQCERKEKINDGAKKCCADGDPDAVFDRNQITGFGEDLDISVQSGMAFSGGKALCEHLKKRYKQEKND